MDNAILKNKKIIFVINNLGVGGAERLVVDDLNEALRQGAQARLLTLKKEKEPPFSFSPDCAIAKKDWRTIDFGSLFNLISWLKVLFYFWQEKPEVVLTHLWFSNTITRVVGKILGIKNILSFEQNVYDAVKTKKMFLADRLLQGWCRKVVAVSVAVKKSLMRHGIKEKNIIVINNAVDISKYNKDPNVILKKNLGIPEGALVFLTIGRLIPQKGIDVLLKAFARLQANPVLLIVGQGTEEKNLKELAASLGIAGRTFFLGVRNDIPEILSIGDIFVLASRYEGLPVVLLEAMAAGRPAVIADFEGGQDIVIPNENGLVVKREDSEALAGAMAELMINRDLRDRLVQGALRSAQDFSIQSHMSRIFKAL